MAKLRENRQRRLSTPTPQRILQMQGPLDTLSTGRYYEKNAESYAKETCSANLQDVWPLLTQRLAPGNLILDLGCGAGRDLAYFNQAGLRVIGLDYSMSLLKIARSVSEQRVVLADLRMLPFRSETFDAVWAIASLLHVPSPHILSALLEVHQPLKRSGVFVASVKEGSRERVDERGRYFADYSPQEWGRLLTKAGFGGVELHLMKESRKTSAGNFIEITWLVSVCTKGRAR